MSWLFLGLISVFFLGLYDICKKFAVTGNAVLPVLFLSSLFGSVVAVAALLTSWIRPDWAWSWGIFTSPIGLREQGFIFLKAGIVSASWVASYYALKHLPLSIASPIRASQPLWTVTGALILFGEKPTSWQLMGLVLVLASYFMLALSSKGQIQGPKPYRWIGLMLLAAALAACSGFYDKVLLQSLKIPPMAVQTYFSLDLVLILGLCMGLFWWPRRNSGTPFQWRWSIPLIGLLLLAADYAYFHALENPEALISVLSPLRRGNAVISFAFGILILKEAFSLRKFGSMIGIVAGMALLVLG